MIDTTPGDGAYGDDSFGYGVFPGQYGMVVYSKLQGGVNATHEDDPPTDTADFADTASGNLRADYVLPRKGLKVTGTGVFWPLRSDPLSRLTGVYSPEWSPVGGFPTSDHRLTWTDLSLHR
ncbi:endonuclease/exonuclease/phosphatase family protein [Actinoplanes missouriensis]|uniref:endonuclease/exonuclease/phosphatase family protein n=1 Tax=Actinoplanes missouriensis TaxID=1866 RepID=UPI0033F6230D